ncbi:MAG: cytochrome c, partial [Chloroflexi bacterium]|nr:cytochrome c [Chloroflexota bacterium]
TPTPTPTPAPTPTPTPVPTGATIYATYCAACHGASGQGTGAGPRIAGKSTSDTIKAVREGEESMPAYSTVQISNANLNLLAAYIREMSSD